MACLQAYASDNRSEASCLQGTLLFITPEDAEQPPAVALPSAGGGHHDKDGEELGQRSLGLNGQKGCLRNKLWHPGAISLSSVAGRIGQCGCNQAFASQLHSEIVGGCCAAFWSFLREGSFPLGGAMRPRSARIRASHHL